MSAHRIDATGSGSSPFPTPAASCYGTNQSPSPGASVRESLETMKAEKMWPTPRAEDSESTGAHRGVADTLTSAVQHGIPQLVPRGTRSTSTVVPHPVRSRPRIPPRQPRPASPCPHPASGRAASNPETRRANGRTVNLGDAVAYWPTPTAGDASSSGNRTGNPDSKAHAGLSLTDATVRTWNTPRSRDWKGGGKDCLDADVAEKTPGSLNPDWVEALMGWPIGWSGPPLEESGRAEEINTTGSLLAFFPEEPEPTSEGSASARSATGKSRPASSPRGASSPAEPWRAEP